MTMHCQNHIKRGIKFEVWVEGKRFFLSPKHPQWLWGPPSFIFN